jgi:hypothetical protein
MSELPQKLTKDQHIIVSLRPEPTVSALKAAIDRGYVHIKFTETRGGTELGIPVDTSRSDFSHADFTQGTGEFTLAGELTLDYVRVRFEGKVDLASMQGTGHLVILQDPAQEATPSEAPAASAS